MPDSNSIVLNMSVTHKSTCYRNFHYLCRKYGIPPTTVTSVEWFHINHAS